MARRGATNTRRRLIASYRIGATESVCNDPLPRISGPTPNRAGYCSSVSIHERSKRATVRY
jgi:hypothetical protein